VKQLKISLPDTLRDQLDAVAAKSGNSVAEEIRRRVERTLVEDDLDPITREFLTGIVNLAANVQADFCAAWHSFQEVHEVFASALLRRLAVYKPLPKSPEEIHNLLRKAGLGDLAASAMRVALQSPDASGVMLERADRRTRTYEHLQRLQEARHRPAPHMRKPKGGDK
jgi:hypothetical protein